VFPIVFDRSDHLDMIPHPRTYPLIIEPSVGSKSLAKVPMDGESSQHHVLRDHRRFGITCLVLCPILTLFHGIILGHQAYPLGQISLLITFGDPTNFRTE
jgi:hypothetical protein